MPDRRMKAMGRVLSFLRDREIVTGIVRGLFLGALILAGVHWWPLLHRHDAAAPPKESIVSRADLHGQEASADVRRIVDWIATTNDASGSAFVVVDKRDARVYVFDGDAGLRASSPVLLGGARGDDTVPGIGAREIADVLPEERTTPAGRFVGERGHNARGEDVVWVDYNAAVSMHRVITSNPEERRLERLATPTSEDNRISYGCINVPVDFYETYIQPTFASHRAIVYVLPEIRSLAEVFGLHETMSASLSRRSS
jgi:hypothetical protein